jgi:hypothetical protein
MTEDEWLKCTDWRKVFEIIEGNVSNRKMRLFAVACCRSAWPLLAEDSRKAVEVAERFADGLATRNELQTVRELFRASETEYPVDIIHGHRYRPDIGGHTADEDAMWAAKAAERGSAELVTWNSLGANGRDFTDVEFGKMMTDELNRRRCLRHDIVGPLQLRSIAVNPTCLMWNDSTIPKLAQAIYEERAFDRLPILADALEEAGCTNQDILNHCRHPGEHVRGCWVVDLVLGKE